MNIYIADSHRGIKVANTYVVNLKLETCFVFFDSLK